MDGFVGGLEKIPVEQATKRAESVKNRSLIPLSFTLGGYCVKVVRSEYPDPENKDVDGQASYYESEIGLTTKYSKDYQEQVFLHELFHWLFFMTGKDKLRCDEALIDSLANYLHQYMKTAKFPTEEQNESISGGVE